MGFDPINVPYFPNAFHRNIFHANGSYKDFGD